MVQTKFSRKITKKQQNMVRGRSFACSSARRIGSMRKKVSQVLPQPGNVVWGRWFRRFFHGIRGRHSSSAGSHGRTCGTFFHRNPRKNLLPFLPQDSTEELLLPLQYLTSPSTCAEEGSSRGRTFVFNLSHHTSLMSSILRPLTLPNEGTRLEH